MAVAVIMPRQGNTVESCIITEWKKKVGDPVAVGDILFAYETDKAAFECEAETAGTLLKIMFEEGDDVPVLENVCVIGNPGENPDDALTGAAAEAPAAGAAPAAAAAAPAAAAGDCQPVIMPRQGNTVESCVITEFFKSVGDQVNVGDKLFAYETDKAAFECEAEFAGTLLAVFYNEGDDVPCLDNVCVIGQPGANPEVFRPGAEVPAAPVAAAPAVEAVPAAEIAEAPVVVGSLHISPRAKKLAEDKKADLSQVVPTGPDGRVIERDVQKLIDEGKLIGVAAEAAAPCVCAAPVELGVPCDDSYTEPMSNIRKVIARSMVASLSTMAQLTHNISYDATEVKNARAMFKAKGEPFGMEKISINDIIMYVVARTLMQPEHRAMNANLIDDGKTMKYYRSVNLGMAVDTERGLMVPTIFNADKMTLKQLSDTAKKLAKECKEGKINPDYLTGASFTVSNIGSLGIESFTPVVNPPQTGILGVCAMKDAFRMVNGQIEVYPSMNLSLSYDHRAMDGTPASKFLRDLKTNLENFTLMLAKG